MLALAKSFNVLYTRSTITDTAMLTAIERYLKQAIVDKQVETFNDLKHTSHDTYSQPLVASAALVAGMKLMKVLFRICT